MIEGVECDECPVSLISLESLAWLDDYYRARRAKEAFGSPPHSGGLEAWPARDLDALDLIQMEDNKYEHAKYDAERSER